MSGFQWNGPPPPGTECTPHHLFCHLLKCKWADWQKKNKRRLQHRSHVKHTEPWHAPATYLLISEEMRERNECEAMDGKTVHLNQMSSQTFLSHRYSKHHMFKNRGNLSGWKAVGEVSRAARVQTINQPRPRRFLKTSILESVFQRSIWKRVSLSLLRWVSPHVINRL